MALRSLVSVPPIKEIPGLCIRRYDPADDPVWEAIIRQCFGTGHEFETAIRHHPSFSPRRVLFAQLDGAVVGTASALRRPSDPSGIGYLCMVAVLPAMRRRGVGRALVISALNQMRTDGRDRALLRVQPSATGAIALYQALGFEVVRPGRLNLGAGFKASNW